MEKRTALDWYIDKVNKLTIKLNDGEINIGQFTVHQHQIYAQAHTMERDQTIDFAKNMIVGMSRKKIEEHYNAMHDDTPDEKYNIK